VSYPFPAGGSAAARIEARVWALGQARQSDIPAGARNAFFVGTAADQRSITVKASIDGDLATVEIAGQPWGYVEAEPDVRGVIQQLVYTISEEPGIRRVKVTEPGKDHAQIPTRRGQGPSTLWMQPLTREDVAGYSFNGTETASIVSDGARITTTIASLKVTNEQIPGLGRFSVEIAGGGTAGGRLMPRVKAALTKCDCDGGKWILRLDLPDTAAPNPKIPFERFTPGPISSLDSPHTRGPEDIGAIFQVGLDDARPWRLTLEPTTAGTTRVNVDVGGRPEWVNKTIAVYSLGPKPGGGGVTVRGAACVFEANVSWRKRDARGQIVARGNATATIGTSPVWGTFEFTAEGSETGPATIEVYWVSPRDGSDQDVITIPLGVR
jgi:hypothetical protein